VALHIVKKKSVECPNKETAIWNDGVNPSSHNI